MKIYYTVNGVPPSAIMAVYRGDEKENKLEKLKSVLLTPPSMPDILLSTDTQTHQGTLGSLYGHFAIANPDFMILCEVDIETGHTRNWCIKRNF